MGRSVRTLHLDTPIRAPWCLSLTRDSQVVWRMHAPSGLPFR